MANPESTRCWPSPRQERGHFAVRAPLPGRSEVWTNTELPSPARASQLPLGRPPFVRSGSVGRFGRLAVPSNTRPWPGVLGGHNTARRPHHHGAGARWPEGLSGGGLRGEPCHAVTRLEGTGLRGEPVSPLPRGAWLTAASPRGHQVAAAGAPGGYLVSTQSRGRLAAGLVVGPLARPAPQLVFGPTGPGSSRSRGGVSFRLAVGQSPVSG